MKANDDIIPGPNMAPTEARRKPLQARALKRHEQILETTAELLDQVGVENLTTILIAKKLNISVGSLYHYFPNKVAILFALSQYWLDDMTEVVERINDQLNDKTEVYDYVQLYTQGICDVYKRQRGIVPLIQAMYFIPELRDLDAEHDQLMKMRIIEALTTIGCDLNKSELNRIAYLFLELVNSMTIALVFQTSNKSKKSLDDINTMAYAFLKQYFN